MIEVGEKRKKSASNPPAGLRPKPFLAERVKGSVKVSTTFAGVGSLAVVTRTNRKVTSSGVLLIKKADREKLNDERGESPCQLDR